MSQKGMLLFSQSEGQPRQPRLTQTCSSPLVPQVLLLFIIILVAAGFVGLEVQWQEEWHSLSLSLQVSG